MRGTYHGVRDIGKMDTLGDELLELLLLGHPCTSVLLRGLDESELFISSRQRLGCQGTQDSGSMKRSRAKKSELDHDERTAIGEVETNKAGWTGKGTGEVQ